MVLTVYMDGLRYSFIFYTVCTGLGLVLSLGIGNTRLDKEKHAEISDEESQRNGKADQGSSVAEDKGTQVVENGVLTAEKGTSHN